MKIIALFFKVYLMKIAEIDFNNIVYVKVDIIALQKINIILMERRKFLIWTFGICGIWISTVEGITSLFSFL